jgi:DNA-binding CsgD family transcriptional regulator/tetratricopeptide (TPR) repeat protein
MSDGVFGRDAELRMVEKFLAGLAAAPAALILVGEPGSGKTTVLRAGLERAASLGYIVLRTLPSPSDMRLAFAGLADLLGARLDTVLPGLPLPQRRALGAALLTEEAPSAPEPTMIAAAFRNAVLLLATAAPVVVVIDDIQWLDTPTGSAVGFALRRLETERVGLLCAQRTGRLGADVLPLGGLDIGALHRLLSTRLGIPLSRPALRRVHAESAGNPFVALEIGRALARRGIVRITDGPLPVPDTLSDLIGERLRELPGSAVGALGIVAVMPGAPVSRYLAAGMAGGDLDAAVVAGVLEVDSGRVRFTHPLLASAVLGAIPPGRRRELHAAAATNAVDAEERAHHRALAADGPDGQIAAELDRAAGLAERRGAPAAAAELLELAASLTPADQAGYGHRRLLAAGRLLHVAGESHAAAAVLKDLAASTSPGPLHAEVIAHLGWNSEDDFEASIVLLEQALAEAGEAPELCASIHSFLSDHWAIVGDVTRARTEAYRALEFAERAGDAALLAPLLSHAFMCDWRCGREVDERQLDRALDLERQVTSLMNQLEPPSQTAGMYLMRVGRLDEAAVALERAHARAEAEGVEYVQADVLRLLSVVTTCMGDPRRGLELAQAGLDLAEQLDRGQLASALLYACAFAALQLGQPGAVMEFTRRGQELSRKAGDQVFLRCHDIHPGELDVALGNNAAAATQLRPLLAHIPELGRNFASELIPETVEALIGTGDLDEAAGLLADLEEHHGSPVTAAVAARCRGALAAARGQLNDAVTELTQALRLHDQMTRQPVQRGRTLLMLGAVQRRLKQRRAARETLAEAIACFEDASARLWVAKARNELARVSGRQVGTGELTVTELRVAEMVARGMTNRAVAAELFVSVRAIESTLTKIYAKLGVQSRTQLASHLHEQPERPVIADPPP